VTGRSEFVFTDHGGGRTDLEALAAQFDTNGDGKIDASDGRWADLHIWADINGDGQFAPDELVPLDEYGVASIDVTPITGVGESADHVTIHGVSTVEMSDGSSIDLADVSFSYRDGAGLPPIDEVLSGADSDLLAVLDAGAGSDGYSVADLSSVLGASGPAGSGYQPGSVATVAEAGVPDQDGGGEQYLTAVPLPPAEELPVDAPAAVA
jgi:hypothetical protein